MTLSQIQCFLVVADKMSITEAANALYVTQPAVSHRISKLEQELGVELFDRDNSRIALTQAGRRYVAFFTDFINGLKKIAEETNSEGVLAEKVVIGCADGWDISRLHKRTKSLIAGKYPGITLKLDCCSNDVLISRMNSRNLDVVLALKNIFVGNDQMRVVTAGRIKGSVIYSAHHPLAGKENLQLADFKDYPVYVIVSQKNSMAAADIVGFCIKNGFQPKTEYVNSLSAALVRIRTEDGILIADDFLIPGRNPMFCLLPVDLERTVCVGMRKNASRACEIVMESLLQTTREFLEENGYSAEEDI